MLKNHHRRNAEIYASQVREPLDKLDRNHLDLDIFEIIMYIMALAFAMEGASEQDLSTSRCNLTSYFRSSQGQNEFNHAKLSVLMGQYRYTSCFFSFPIARLDSGTLSHSSQMLC